MSESVGQVFSLKPDFGKFGAGPAGGAGAGAGALAGGMGWAAGLGWGWERGRWALGL